MIAKMIQEHKKQMDAEWEVIRSFKQREKM